jgi:hypothetical protein
MPTQEPERDEALNAYLQRVRKESGLSLDQVCERTKIQGRYVLALEEGRFGELPSNTHLRAFSLALAQACGGDSELAALLVRRVLTAVAAPGAAPASLATPRVSPKFEAPRPAARPVAPPQAAVAAAAVAVVPVVHRAGEAAAEAAEGLLQGASLRLKALPWQALLVLVGGAMLLSWGLVWGMERLKAPVAPLAVTEAPAGDKVSQAPTASAEAVTASVAADAPAPAQLVLRARRQCWLVLQIDGQRLPTVILQDGDKRSWPVSQKAVLLAGNIGALRVWWRGDNLGYLGELSRQANGVVFEPGKAFRIDKGANLALPAGVPE